MCNHKLVLAGDGRALMCILPDCRTGGKPFVIAGGDGAPGPGGWGDELPKIKVVGLDYEEISLCPYCEVPYRVVGEFVKAGDQFCSHDGKLEAIYRLPNCSACGRIIRINVLVSKDRCKENRFCTACGAQVLKNGELVTA